MIKANIHEVKTHFSEYLAKVEAGELVLVCKRNIPIVEMRAVSHPSAEPRPIGLAKDKFEIPAAFFEALPLDIIESFYDGKT